MRPLYVQLYEEFRDKIIQGEYKIKDQFGEGQAYGDGGFRFDDIFSAFGGGGARGQSQQGGFRSQNSQGQDQHAEITVDLSSVYSGDDYSIKLNVPVRQPNGSVDYENKTDRKSVV